MPAGISNRTRLDWRRSYAGPAFLSERFRPLFLAAGLWAAISAPLWIGVWSGKIVYAGLFGPVTWHVHEMMFGFVGAALGGFVLTAVPNWTGWLPVRGVPLAALALAWVAGRAAVWWGAALGPVPTTIADLAFLGALAVLVGNEIVAGRNWRNVPVLAGLVLMVAANALFHLGASDVVEVEETGVRLSVAVIAFLVAMVGGRIVPSFTRNWFARRRGPKIAGPMGRFDRVTIAVTGIALAAWVGSAPEYVSGALLVASGMFNLVRLARWRGWMTVAEPLLAVLHVGYLWLTIGLGMLGLSRFGDRVTEAMALHMLTIGAMGTMTLAVMIRAALGHTGREVRREPYVVAIFALATLAVFARVGFEIESEIGLLWVTAGSWSLAFALFAAFHAPMLFLPRKSRGPSTPGN